jgi:hypothetical protein
MQHLELNSGQRVRRLGIRFTTFGRVQAPFAIRYRFERGQGNVVIAAGEIPRASIADNAWAFIEFPHLLELEKGRYTLVLEAANGTGKDSLSAWTTQGYERSGTYLEVNGVRTGGTLSLTMDVADRSVLARLGRRWRVIEREPEVTVLENTDVRGGAYFVRNLAPAEGSLDFSSVTADRPSSGVVSAIYRGALPGWVVFPMRLRPGWVASVDGRQVAAASYCGILPAIPVPSAATIRYAYEPASFRWGAGITVLGLMLFVWFFLACRLSGKRP